jgi:hypothetical protein
MKTTSKLVSLLIILMMNSFYNNFYVNANESSDIGTRSSKFNSTSISLPYNAGLAAGSVITALDHVMTVSFKGDKAINGTDIQGYSNVIDSTVIENKSYPGETALGEEVADMLQLNRKQGCHIRLMI